MKQLKILFLALFLNTTHAVASESYDLNPIAWTLMSAGVGTLGGLYAANIDSSVVDTSCESLTILTFTSEAAFRFKVIELLGRFLRLSEMSTVWGHFTSRTASYISYYFTFNKKVRFQHQRIHASDWVILFALPLFLLGH
jgi:hypothetical protein